MTRDTKIRLDVIEELRWVPDIDDSHIEVQVNDGIVTLAGFVPEFNDRFQAECAAKRVSGVAGVANELKVSSAYADRRADAVLAREAVAAIRADLPDIAGNIKVVVSDGHVTLEGTVEWFWQRQRLEATVRSVEGVCTLVNLITVAPSTTPVDIKQRIEAAFIRSAEVDASKVSVDARDGEVTLRGTVSSLREKDEALRTAWSAPGVRQVHNEIKVER
ncbi:MAG TPA: BON domain-containing protein [Steroidobacteraceae bacterium]|jgi:osmotically-inducible protein OsmY|nr:BON domain-containing protein [Steroidobacteraceae bacterium]